ncbi:sulfotransferase family 2 domain-containing protein [Maricaulis sp.]|uniref:sulfotransferase family 2 domain-containing protein n=1 Tax=Maricaulis sp. TaxID=1486257 RepID=UPI003A8E0423
MSVHIRKCAGSTFKAALRESFGSRVLFDYGDEIGSNWPSSVEKRKRRLKAAIDSKAAIEKNYDVIHGHFFREKYNFLTCERAYITFMRNPLYRILSNYYYLKRNPKRANPDAIIVNKLSYTLEEFAAHPDNQNLQSQFIQSKNLDEFSVVGIVEDYELSIERINYVHGTNLGCAHRENVNENSDENYDVPKRTIAIINANNLEDLRLYDKARNQLAKSSFWV